MVTVCDRRGLLDWLIQRATAILIGAYALFICFYCFINAPLSYGVWHHLYEHVWMRVLTTVVAVHVMWHAWIGLWIVLTDYIHCRWKRFILQWMIVLLLCGYGFWILNILWMVEKNTW